MRGRRVPLERSPHAPPPHPLEFRHRAVESPVSEPSPSRRSLTTSGSAELPAQLASQGRHRRGPLGGFDHSRAGRARTRLLNRAGQPHNPDGPATAGCAVGECDSPAGIDAHLRGERVVFRRHPVWMAEVRSGEGIQQQHRCVTGQRTTERRSLTSTSSRSRSSTSTL